MEIPTPPQRSAARLREVLRQRPAKELPTSDVPEHFRRAAVLVPLWEHQGDVWTLVTERSASMPQHAGEMAFPGGGRSGADPTLAATALREAEEEVGLSPSLVDLVGPLDEVWTMRGFVVQPWVGWLPKEPTWRPEAREIQSVISFPLRALEEAGVYSQDHWTGKGWRLTSHRYDVQGKSIWGMTASILHALLALWRGDVPSACPNGEETLRIFMDQRGGRS